MSERAKRWLRIPWALAIVTDMVASLLPGDSLAIRKLNELSLNDKLEHMVMYAAIAVWPAIHVRRRFLWM